MKRSLTDLSEAGVSSSSSVPASAPTDFRKISGGSLFGQSEIAQDFVMIDLKTPFAQT